MGDNMIFLKSKSDYIRLTRTFKRLLSSPKVKGKVINWLTRPPHLTSVMSSSTLLSSLKSHCSPFYSLNKTACDSFRAIVCCFLCLKCSLPQYPLDFPHLLQFFSHISSSQKDLFCSCY